MRLRMKDQYQDLYSPSTVDTNTLVTGMVKSVEGMTAHFHAYSAFRAAYNLIQAGDAPPPITTVGPLFQWPSGHYTMAPHYFPDPIFTVPAVDPDNHMGDVPMGPVPEEGTDTNNGTDAGAAAGGSGAA